jgi:hypothetical protein
MLVTSIFCHNLLSSDTALFVLPTHSASSFHLIPLIRFLLLWISALCTMSGSKSELDIDLRRDSESQEDVVVSEKKGTHDDQKDMHRMGKTQELRRNFRFVSIFGYSMILMATWETALT